MVINHRLFTWVIERWILQILRNPKFWVGLNIVDISSHLTTHKSRTIYCWIEFRNAPTSPLKRILCTKVTVRLQCAVVVQFGSFCQGFPGLNPIRPMLLLTELFKIYLYFVQYSMCTIRVFNALYYVHLMNNVGFLVFL